MNVKDEVDRLFREHLPSVKDGLLAQHRRLNNDYDGFDTYADYVKYGEAFVHVDLPKEDEDVRATRRPPHARQPDRHPGGGVGGDPETAGRR
jgi:hypothetical protein